MYCTVYAMNYNGDRSGDAGVRCSGVVCRAACVRILFMSNVSSVAGRRPSLSTAMHGNNVRYRESSYLDVSRACLGSGWALATRHAAAVHLHTYSSPPHHVPAVHGAVAPVSAHTFGREALTRTQVRATRCWCVLQALVPRISATAYRLRVAPGEARAVASRLKPTRAAT